MAEVGFPARRRARGFTLIEILVAFAILALAFAAVMQAMSGGLRILSVSGSHAEALRIAENRLAEAGRALPLEASTEFGETGRYRWRREVTPYEGRGENAASVPPAYVVKVTVTWEGNRKVSLSTVNFGAPADG